MKKLILLLALAAMCVPRAQAQAQGPFFFYHYDRDTETYDESIKYRIGSVIDVFPYFSSLKSDYDQTKAVNNTITIPKVLYSKEYDAEFHGIQLMLSGGDMTNPLYEVFKDIDTLVINCDIIDHITNTPTSTFCGKGFFMPSHTRQIYDLFYHVKYIKYKGNSSTATLYYGGDDPYYSEDGILYRKSDDGTNLYEKVAWVPSSWGTGSEEPKLSTIIRPTTKEILPYAFRGYLNQRSREEYANKNVNNGLEIDFPTEFPQVTIIDPYAFQGANVKKITLPDNAAYTAVEAGTFADCYNLTEVVMQPQIKSVGDYAFARTPELNVINLENVEAIGNFAFNPSDAGQYVGYSISRETNDGDKITYKAPTGMYTLLGSLYRLAIVPSRYGSSGTVSISDSPMLTSVNLSKCKSIGLSAFKSQYKLTTVTFSPDLVSLDDEAFHNTAINSIDLSMATGLKTIPTHCFCINVMPALGMSNRTVKLPTGIERIKREAFASKTPLTIGTSDNVLDLTPYSSLVEVGQAAFDGATAETVNLPTGSTLTTLDGSSLYGLWNLKEIQIGGSATASNDNFQVQDGILFNKAMTTIVRYPQARQNKGYIVPATVTTLGKCAFEQYSLYDNPPKHRRGLQHLVLPSGLTTIEGLALFQEHPYDYSSVQTSQQAAAIRDANTTVERPYPAENWMPEITIPATVTAIKNIDKLCIGAYHRLNASNYTSMTPTYYLNNLGLGNYYAIYFMHNADQLASLTIDVPVIYGSQKVNTTNSVFYYGSAIYNSTSTSNSARGAFRSAATDNSPGYSTSYVFKPSALNAAKEHTVLKNTIYTGSAKNDAQRRQLRDDIPIRFTSVGKASICRDFDVNLNESGITAYAATTYDADNKEVELVKVKYGEKTDGKYIPSRFSTDNHSYMGAILKLDDAFDADKTYTYRIGEQDYTSASRYNPTADMYDDNQNILGAVVHTDAVQGADAEGYTYFGLAGDGMFQRFAWTSGTGEERIAYNKAYLRIKDYTASEAKVNMFFREDDDDDNKGTTGINNLNDERQNGEGNAWYTLQGVRLSGKPAQGGIYIHNGRKEVIK